jgi:hypothetical protein
MMIGSYWNGNGKYMQAVKELQKLFPDGLVKNPTKNKALERFRKACHRYYRLFNAADSGVGSARIFRVEQPSRFRTHVTFKDTYGYQRTYPSWTKDLYTNVEWAMNKIIEEAALEQGVDL